MSVVEFLFGVKSPEERAGALDVFVSLLVMVGMSLSFGGCMAGGELFWSSMKGEPMQWTGTGIGLGFGGMVGGLLSGIRIFLIVATEKK
jgi:hypothetical protein